MIGPFYTGAGFGLYLTRRTEMEAWDVEIAFRRLRDRLQQAAPLLVLALVLAWPGTAVHAQSADADAPSLEQLLDDAEAEAETDTRDAERPTATYANDPTNTAAGIFGADPVDTAGFRQAVQRAYEDLVLAEIQFGARPFGQHAVLARHLHVAAGQVRPHGPLARSWP